MDCVHLPESPVVSCKTTTGGFSLDCEMFENFGLKNIYSCRQNAYIINDHTCLYIYTFLLMKNIINITYNKKDSFRLALSSSSKEVIGQLNALWGRWRYLTFSFYFFRNTAFSTHANSVQCILSSAFSPNKKKL